MSCFEIWQSIHVGSGKVGFGTNVSNLITGVFIATGQDVASIESSHCHLHISPMTYSEWTAQSIEAIIV